MFLAIDQLYSDNFYITFSYRPKFPKLSSFSRLSTKMLSHLSSLLPRVRGIFYIYILICSCLGIIYETLQDQISSVMRIVPYLHDEEEHLSPHPWRRS